MLKLICRWTSRTNDSVSFNDARIKSGDLSIEDEICSLVTIIVVTHRLNLIQDGYYTICLRML